jgi:hypothetical protein
MFILFIPLNFFRRQYALLLALKVETQRTNRSKLNESIILTDKIKF